MKAEEYYDEFFGTGYWEQQYKKHIVAFAEQHVLHQNKELVEAVKKEIKALEHTVQYFKEPRTQVQSGRLLQAKKTLSALQALNNLTKTE